MKATVLKNCRLIREVSGNVPFTFADVAFTGGKITVIEPAGKYLPAPGDQTVDCTGKTLLPGLYDIHQHSDAISVNFLDNRKILDPYDFLNQVCLWSMRMLRMGYTSLRCMGAQNLAGIRLRKMVDAGVFNGPRVFACGNTIAGTTKQVISENPGCDGPAEWMKAARTAIANDADFIKIYASGSVMANFGEPGQMVVTPEEIAAAVQAASARGVYAAAHAHSTESIQACLDAGVRTIEHATWLTRDQCHAIKDAGDRHFIVPTLSVMQWCASIAETDNPELYYLADRAAKVMDSAKESIARAYDEGLLLGWGTDLDVESLEKEPGQEFRLRREWCGMSGTDMIRQATMNSAYIVGLGDVSGQIKPGYEADLLLYDGNPDEDISLFNTRPIVYKRGRLVDETFPVKK